MMTGEISKTPADLTAPMKEQEMAQQMLRIDAHIAASGLSQNQLVSSDDKLAVDCAKI
jgi:hypothetical protein